MSVDRKVRDLSSFGDSCAAMIGEVRRDYKRAICDRLRGHEGFHSCLYVDGSTTAWADEPEDTPPMVAAPAGPVSGRRTPKRRG